MTTTVRGGLVARLQALEDDIKYIRVNALMIGDGEDSILHAFAKQIKEFVEKVEDNIKKSVNETEACVEEMGRDYVKKADLQAYLDEKIKEAVEKIVKSTNTNVEEDRPERGLYLTGVGRLREVLDSSSEDPCDVVHTALHRVGSAAFYTKIVPVFSSTKLRKDVDQVIVYFSSVYHRKYASAELRRFFAREKILRVSLRDLFEKSDIDLAKRMTKLGFQLKQEAKICRFRVSNFRGVPTLFLAGQDRKYSEMDKRTMQAKLDAMN